MNVTQCPNCGGFRTFEHWVKLDADSNEIVHDNRGWVAVGLVMTAILFALSWVLWAWWLGSVPGSSSPVTTFLVAAVTVAMVTVMVVCFYMTETRKARRRRVIRAISGWCDICGYRWIRRQNDPPATPAVGANSELIYRAFEQRKREEEERLD